MSGFLARLYPKLRSWLTLCSKNPDFLAKIFSISAIIGEIEKVNLSSHKDFRLEHRFTIQDRGDKN
jgi:hypothetical protein